nr:hypothetical transcript [Hymenolepis microstoma]
MATGSTEKYMSKFDINETITLKLEDETERRYQLFGIVLHAGGLATFGHYLWACKMDGQWAIFSDGDVVMVDSEQPFSASDLRRHHDSIAQLGTFVLYYSRFPSDLFRPSPSAFTSPPNPRLRKVLGIGKVIPCTVAFYTTDFC